MREAIRARSAEKDPANDSGNRQDRRQKEKLCKALLFRSCLALRVFEAEHVGFQLVSFFDVFCVHD